ncbi:MAG TPA: di-heme oxidoredictase family protein [Methylomirabilota bacterium]|nr:di-heme oxidoredictase family protein [Methylomirabilota bacterium]
MTRLGCRFPALFLILLLALTVFPMGAFAQKDRGVRPGPPGAGAPLNGLTPIELSMFNEGFQRMVQLEGVCDDCSDLTLGSYTDPAKANLVTQTNSSGLGVRFNGDQCSVCHNQPVVGGSGGFMVPNPQDPPGQQHRPENPMFDLIPHRKGAINAVPSFIHQYGPIREVRFARKPDGTPDGGVHQLFTIVGRSDIFPAGQPNTCTAADLPPTDFEKEYKNGNVRFRIPLQLYGLGILDGIQDREILGRHAASAGIREELGIRGMPNRSGNDGTITRFGWKAQNKSIMIFAGEAYNVEMGVTNDIFPQATDESPACTADKSEPNDIFRSDPSDAINQGFNNPLHELPDWQMFAIFMRFLDAPQQAPLSASAQRGQQLFGMDTSNPGIGCVACHTATMVTPAKSETEGLQSLTVHPYSDLLIHHMGKGLADDITQGLATGDMFRTTPLWGVGQRIFFLHDGRTNDLLKAIHAHYSPGDDCEDSRNAPCYGPSEANTVIQRFDALTPADKQAILDFLRSL